MKMRHRYSILQLCNLAAGIGVCVAAHAKLAHVWEPVPISRLVANLGSYIKEHPTDAKGYYTLGRIHSIAYAQSTDTVEVVMKDWQTSKPLDVPRFPAFQSILSRPSTGQGFPKDRFAHMLASVRNYKRSTDLAPKEALYWLGLGWMLEQGAADAGDLGSPPGYSAGKGTKDYWTLQALTAYRNAFTLSKRSDERSEGFNRSHADDAISVEAGEGILRLVGSGPLSKAEQDEQAAIKAHIKMIAAKPHYITPIIFPLQSPASLLELLTPERAVHFDLSGELRSERWPWVGPETGILVWDPQHTGKITSGRQMFGSRTWQGIWRNGYEPLAALDDNGDGKLTGKELEGIAVWVDRNGNGRSDPGEVTPIQTLGVSEVQVRPAGESEGVPFNPEGIRMQDGAVLPSYDWTPQSIPDDPLQPGLIRAEVIWN